MFAGLFADRLAAQTYNRTKKNIGIFGTMYLPEFSARKGSNSGTTKGTGFAVGLTRKMGNVFYPEIFFVNHRNQVILPDSADVWRASSVSSNSIGAGFLLKLDLFTFNSKKKNGYCFARILNLILGPEFVYPISLSAPAGIKQKPEFALKAGLGMYSVWGGSSKGHKGWTIHWEAYYRRGFTPYLRSDFGELGNHKYMLSSIAVTLRIIRFKTYKFSDM